MIRISLSAIIISLWLVCFTSKLSAQQRAVTLRDIWLATEHSYPGVLATRSAIQSSEYERAAIKANGLPQLKMQLQNSYGTFEGSSGAFFPQTGFFNVSGNGLTNNGTSTAANSFASAIVEYELFNFGRQKAEEKSAAIMTSKVTTDQQAYLLNLKKELSKRYIQLLFNSEKLKWAEKNAKRINEIHQISRGMSRAGLKPQADSVLTYSGYIQALSQSDYLRGQLRAATEKLKELYVRDIDAAAFASSGFLLPSYGGDNQETINPSHPFIETFRVEASYYENKAKAQNKASLPSLKALAGYSYRGTGIGPDGNVSERWTSGFSNPANNYLVGLGITWNISGLYAGKQKASALSKESERLLHIKDQYETALKADVTAIRAKISEQQKQLGNISQSVKSALLAYEMYTARYKSGLIGLTELLQVRLILENAENQQIEASRDYWFQVVERSALTTNFDFLFNNL